MITRFFLGLATLALGACADSPCPEGTREEGVSCVAIDAGADDSGGDVPDSGADVLDGSRPDANDGGPDGGPDAGPCGECAAEMPMCDTDTMTCVECLVPTDCTDAMCSDAGTCVECTEDSHCAEAGASVCSIDGATAGTCVACTAGSATDCAGVMDGATSLNVCDDSGDAAVCVGCTEASAADDCGDFSCNPATRLCTETERGDVPDCGRCVGDAECNFDGGFRCVPMNFQGAPRPDGYCLKLVSETCAPPYGFPLALESLSGLPESMYCGIDQNATTCDAVRALRDSDGCADGAGGQDAALCADMGARCEMVGAFADRCTIPCGSPDECLTSGPASTCATDYCGS